jgi:hypothetical protein
VDGVQAEPADDGVTRYQISPKENRDLREAIFARVAQNGWSLRRLDLRRRKLEDHFVDLIVRDQQDGFAAVPPPSPFTAVPPPAPPAPEEAIKAAD